MVLHYAQQKIAVLNVHQLNIMYNDESHLLIRYGWPIDEFCGSHPCLFPIHHASRTDLRIIYVE